MYPGRYAQQHANEPAFIMANSGEVVTYAELEVRSNRLAHMFRANGLQRLDHYAIFMENNSRYIEVCAAGARAGLYYTCVNAFLTAEELAYILNNSESKVLITSRAKLEVAAHALKLCPDVRLCLVADGGADAPPFLDLAEATAAFPGTPIADEWLGTAMLYSSGTTGRPKGILRPLPENRPFEPLPLFHFLNKLCGRSDATQPERRAGRDLVQDRLALCVLQ
jgi:long-chain acyl-CoA synthetase